MNAFAAIGAHVASSLSCVVTATWVAAAVSAQCGEPVYTWHGDSTEDVFGISVSAAGDVDGDGFDDVIVGAPGDEPNGERSGSAYVFSGATGALLHVWHGDSEFDTFGTAVSGAGDVDRDGFDDVIIGAGMDATNGLNGGSAYVFSGATGLLIHTWSGDAGDALGSAVSGAGDVNGDGVPDLIVGSYLAAPRGIMTGSAHVFCGATGALLHSWSGDSNDDHFGGAVSGAGDVDGDGLADLIVGAWGDDFNGNGSGSAFVFSGASGTLLHVWRGSELDLLGLSVSGAGDVDGDGLDDIIVGAPWDDVNGADSGSAFVFSGIDGSRLYAWHGDDAGARFGWSVSGGIDLDGDSRPDLIVGAPYSGSTHVFSGASGDLRSTWQGEFLFGASVSGAGDVNGDGHDDAIIGWPRDDVTGFASGSASVFTLKCPSGHPADLIDFNFSIGSHLAGTLLDLVASDDSYLQGRSQFGFSALEPNIVELMVGAISPRQRPSSLDISIESHINNPGGAATVKLRNWSSGAFESIHTYPTTQTDATETIAGVPAAGYIRPADDRIEMAVRHTVIATFSAGGFESSFDFIEMLLSNAP